MCPPGAEATVFAMLTALSNFGAAVSSYFGATLLVVFNIQGGNYDNLMWLLIVKKCCRLTTLLLVHALVPPGCPNDTGEIKNPADDGLWGADNGFSESNRHNFGNLCGVGASTHGLLDSSHGKGVDNSTHSNDSSFSDATAKNPIFLQAKVPLEYVETAVEMKSLTPSLAVGLDDKMVVKSKESPSRLIRYIPPHDNMTTQNV